MTRRTKVTGCKTTEEKCYHHTAEVGWQMYIKLKCPLKWSNNGLMSCFMSLMLILQRKQQHKKEALPHCS